MNFVIEWFPSRMLQHKISKNLTQIQTLKTLRNNLEMRMKQLYIIFEEQTDLLNEILNEIDPKFFNSASDDSLEELASIQYDAVYGFGDAINKGGKNFETLVKEIQRRGMHTAKDQNGIDRFPYARIFIEDYNDEIARNALDLSLPNTALKMTDDDSGKSTEQLIKELIDDAFKSQYEFVKKQLEETTDFSPEKIDRIAEKRGT